MHLVRWCIYCLCCATWLRSAAADEVRLPLPNGLVATAGYKAGNANLPAVLILHGFLQTRDFPTVHQLAGNLSAAGYTVLAPNLSLGISRRAKSLACEAIHTHSLEGDLTEIDAWVNWLAHKGYGHIVVIGHSYGSLLLLAYLAGHPSPTVKKMIAVSLVNAHINLPDDQWKKMEAGLKDKVTQNDASLVQYPLSYCKKFPAPAKNYLSYASWRGERVLETLPRLKVPVTVIMGGSDGRLDAGWLEQLGKAHTGVITIKGANHFMDGQYEFELFDTVLGTLRAPSRKR